MFVSPVFQMPVYPPALNQDESHGLKNSVQFCKPLSNNTVMDDADADAETQADTNKTFRKYNLYSWV